MNRPAQPTPLQTLAVRLALHRFHQRYPRPCADRHEWNTDCEMVAWRAVVEAEAHDTPEIATPFPDEPNQETVEKWLMEAIGDGRGLVLSEAERARVLSLARCAENALKRWWRDERRYYSRCVALVEQDEAGEWVERKIEDERAWEALMGVLEQACCERLLARLEAESDTVERAILAGLRAEKTQAEIAQALGMSRQAVGKRIAKIRAKAREIWGEIGGKIGGNEG